MRLEEKTFANQTNFHLIDALMISADITPRQEVLIDFHNEQVRNQLAFRRNINNPLFQIFSSPKQATIDSAVLGFKEAYFDMLANESNDLLAEKFREDHVVLSYLHDSQYNNDFEAYAHLPEVVRAIISSLPQETKERFGQPLLDEDHGYGILRMLVDSQLVEVSKRAHAASRK